LGYFLGSDTLFGIYLATRRSRMQITFRKKEFG